MQCMHLFSEAVPHTSFGSFFVHSILSVRCESSVVSAAAVVRLWSFLVLSLELLKEAFESFADPQRRGAGYSSDDASDAVSTVDSIAGSPGKRIAQSLIQTS